MDALYQLTGSLVSAAWNWGSSIDDRKKYELSKRIEETVAHINEGENDGTNLEELRAILLDTHDLGLTQEKVKELNIIRQFCDQIILKTKIEIPESFPKELRMKIFDSCAFKFSKIFENYKANEIIDWIISTGNSISITNADLGYIGDFDNDCLKKLTMNCPNLKHLNLVGIRIKGFALDYLKYVKGLQRLKISGWWGLHTDALRGLQHVPELQVIELHDWREQKQHYLKYVTKLKKIKLFNCEVNNLRNLQALEFFPDLECLSVRGSCLRDEDLKNLKYVKKLKTLKICSNVRLESDALKHLVHVPELKELYSENDQFEKGSTKYLSLVPKLEKLNGVKYEIGQDPRKKPKPPEKDLPPFIFGKLRDLENGVTQIYLDSEESVEESSEESSEESE